MNGCSFNKGVVVFLFCLAIAATGNTSVTLSVYNGSNGTRLPGQQVLINIYSESGETAISTVSDTNGDVAIADYVLGSAHALRVTSKYKGHLFYLNTPVSESTANLVLYVYEPGNDPDNIVISNLHTVISPAREKLIFDIRMAVTNTGDTYYVSGNYGFTYRIADQGTLLEASPTATQNGAHILFFDGVRPSTSVFSFRYSVPFAYKKPYRYVVQVPYPVHGMLFVGDPELDVVTDHQTAKRSVKSVATGLQVPYLTVSDLTNDMAVTIIPVNRSQHHYMLETLAGFGIALSLLFWYRRRKKMVPAYESLVESISNRERYDRELHKK